MTGKEREQPRFGEERVNTFPKLPDSFTNIYPAFIAKKKPSPPHGGVIDPEATLLRLQLGHEYEWLQKVTAIEGRDGAVNVTW